MPQGSPAAETGPSSPPPPAAARPIEGPSAWVRGDISPTAVTVELGDAARGELLDLARHLRSHRLPTLLLRPEDYALPACRAVARRVRALLDEGPRFCLLDRLPVEELDEEEAKACYWLFSAMVCRPVAQKLDGTMIYDVQDTGRKADPGSGVRPDKTNIDLTFHNDNAYNPRMPEVVALLCLRPAKSGGRSRVMSFDTVHNRLLETAPEVLPRLYRPFWFDRQREHRPDEEPTFAAPVFTGDGEQVKARLGLHQVRNAYAMRGEALDPEGAAAIAALEAVFAEPGLQFDFEMAAGQIQFVDNLAIGHSRTQFEDFEEPARRRHLVRLWMRDAGDRAYTG